MNSFKIKTISDRADVRQPHAGVENPATADPWIFREGRRSISRHEVLGGIARQLGREAQGWTDALIQAGELEAALADVRHDCAPLAAQLTDALACAVCTGEDRHAAEAADMLSRLNTPEWLDMSPPEGFTYYALHPLDFARLTGHIPAEPVGCAVIGIRSIGTTLSAMASASLRLSGRVVDRITVRPTGHPYARKMEFSPEQGRWINERLAKGLQFLVVDEGPGRSGSTFLSIAEALLHAGVARERITILGSRQPDLESLCAENAAGRWRRFRFLATSPSVNIRFKDCVYAGGGCWREIFFPDKRDWPESWTQMERLKFISPDHETLYKFEGMGRIGTETRRRAFILSEAGFVPKVSDTGDGFLAYQLVEGDRMAASNVDFRLLDAMARYCAFREENFAQDVRDPLELGRMLEFNVRQEFGIELNLPAEEIAAADPVLVDGKMQPHEWIATAPDRFLKTDAVDHGDNHFFPGPCDIAWDLAGIAIEWRLAPAALDALLERFSRYSGTDLRPRLKGYLLAYTIFRLEFCKMARSTVRGSAEEPRLAAAYAYYRGVAAQLLEAKLQRPVDAGMSKTA